MGKFTGYEKTGFNTTGNNQSSMSNYNSGRSIYAVGLGRTRSTIGSITRKFNYCNLTAPDLNVAFRCTFDLPNKPPVVEPDILPESGNYITIVCQNGAILVSTDGGKNFTPKVTTPPISSLFQVSMSDTGRYQLVSDADVDTENGVFISNDFGKTFLKPSSPPSTNLAFISLVVSRTGRFQTVISKQLDNKLYISSDFGNTWKEPTVSPKIVNPNFQIIAVSMNREGRLQICLCYEGSNNKSELFISRDFGITWEKLKNSLFLGSLFSINLSDNAIEEYGFITAGELTTDKQTKIHYGTLVRDIGGPTFSDWKISIINPIYYSSPSIFNVVSDYFGRIQVAIGGYSYGQLLNKSYVYISRDFAVTWRPADIPGGENLYWLSCSISKDGGKIVALACDAVLPQPPLTPTYDIPNVNGNFYYYYSFDRGFTWKSTKLDNLYPGVGIYIN